MAAIKLLMKSYLFDAHADAFNIVNHLPPAVFCPFTRVLKKIGVTSGAKALLETDWFVEHKIRARRYSCLDGPSINIFIFAWHIQD